MATVLSAVLDKFYERLGESEEIDRATIDSLRELIQSEKKLKAEDLVAILSDTRNERPS